MNNNIEGNTFGVLVRPTFAAVSLAEIIGNNIQFCAVMARSPDRVTAADPNAVVAHAVVARSPDQSS